MTDTASRPAGSGSRPPAERDAVVLGGGPAGLAVAAELKRAGVRAVVLEECDRPGSRWADRYDRLHLHTARRFSALPGLPLPPSAGRWVSRDAFVRYLAAYPIHHSLEVHYGTPARQVRQDGDGWVVDWAADGDAGEIRSRAVIVATGLNAVPRLPDVPGRDSYTGRLLHSSEYRNPGQLAASSVLVIGAGNSGAEIAAELAGAGLDVRLAIRTPPNIVRRQTLGVPSQAIAVAVSRLPVRWADRITGFLQRRLVGDLTRYGIPRSPRGIVTQATRDGVTPTIDVGLLAALEAGTVQVVPAVVGFEEDAVVLADGSRLHPDAVVAATGYRANLDRLVGGLRALDPTGRPRANGRAQLASKPGLYFTGFVNVFGGLLRQAGIDGRRIARSVARRIRTA